jgi:hypothetical protein
MVKRKEIVKAVGNPVGPYQGRVVSREPYIPSLSTMEVYELEVRNTNNSKVKRRKIGTAGILVGDGSHPITYSTVFDTPKFTSKGLEITVSDRAEEMGLLFAPTMISEKKLIIISRDRFPS